MQNHRKTTIVHGDVMNRWILLAAVVSAPAAAQNPGGLTSLSAVVNDARSACSTMAASHQDKERLDALNRRLEAQEAMQRLRNDVELYGIGHGRENTRRYMLDSMERQAKLESEAADRGILVTKERDAEVAACVADAVPKGKAAYSAFKKGKRGPADLNLANDLMTSWLVNVETISLNQPEGTGDSNEAWKRAKAAVELSSP